MLQVSDMNSLPNLWTCLALSCLLSLVQPTHTQPEIGPSLLPYCPHDSSPNGLSGSPAFSSATRRMLYAKAACALATSAGEAYERPCSTRHASKASAAAGASDAAAAALAHASTATTASIVRAIATTGEGRKRTTATSEGQKGEERKEPKKKMASKRFLSPLPLISLSLSLSFYFWRSDDRYFCFLPWAFFSALFCAVLSLL